MLLAVHAVQVGNLEGLASVTDEKLCVGAHRSLVDTENTELARIRIVGNLEDVTEHVSFRIWPGCHSLAIRALSKRWRVTFGWVGQQTLGQLQKMLAACASGGRSEANRYQVSLTKGDFEGIM